MGIVDEDVAAVRAASDIVAIVSQYVQLRKVGAQWSGRCPFHSENTPSFSVNGNDNVFYCFGCQAQGDVITFVQMQEQLGFPEAVEWLAAKANMVVHYTDRQQGEGRKQRARLVEVMERAVEWYHQRLLTGSDAGPARSYLRGRGIDGEVVREFRIGWAPDAWDELCRALRLDEKAARETGLGKRNSRGRLQDHFRGRILFPIGDDQGNPISFGGRILPGGERPGNQGKYQNTTETPLYTKSRVLYGLDRAKKAVVAADTVVVCEGYTDVIGFHRRGVPLAVATCGTALTDDHVKLLRRFARRFVLAFDADGAGQAAAERFYRWEREHDLEVAVADLPPGQDPGDLAQSDPDRLPAAVDGARPFLRFRLDRAFAAADLSSPEGRAKVAKQALALVGEHPDVFVRDQYLLDVAGRCRIEPDRLRQQFEELQRAPAPRDDRRPNRGRGSSSRPGRAAGPGSSPRPRGPSRARPEPGREGRADRVPGPPAGDGAGPAPAAGSAPPAAADAWGDEGVPVANVPMDDVPPAWADEPSGAGAPGPAAPTSGPRPGRPAGQGGDRPNGRGRDRSGPPATRSSRSGPGGREATSNRAGPGLEVLRHAVHDPVAVAPWLDEIVFDDPVQVGVFRALVGADTTEAALAGAEPAVADQLRRLLVESPVSEPFEAVRLLLSQVIHRELRLLNATGADDPQEVVRQSVELRLMLKGLNGKETATAAESADRLLAWLRQRVGDGG